MRYRSLLHLKCVATLWAIFMFFAVSAFAESSAIQIPAGTSVLKNNKTKKNNEAFKVLIELDLNAISYAEPSNVDNNFQQQAQIALNLKKQGSVFSETNIIIGTFSEPQSVYYALPEGYIGFGSKDSNLIIGRKKENLSFADSFFHFGLIQSNFTNDNIDFIEGGLTGLSARYSYGGMGVMADFMPIFIPNQGPQVKAEDGRIVSSNRWASSPPSKFKFGEEHKDINYAIRDYNMTDIISNSGFMLHAFMGQQKSTRPVFAATYAKKPINEVALSRDTYSDISNFEGYVFLTPVVLTHEVMAADLNLDYENFNSSLSYLADEPNNKDATGLEVLQNLSPLKIVSLYASLDLSEVLDKKIKVYTAAAAISGGEIRDLNSEKKESVFAVANSRTLFKRPVCLGLKGEMFYVYNEAVESDVSLTYDQELKGSLLSMQFKYSPFKNMGLSIGTDIIGVENELPADVQGNFLDQNKANDRFSAGIDYVF